MCAIENTVTLTKKVTIAPSKAITRDSFVQKLKEIASNLLAFLKENGCKKLGHLKFIVTTDGEDYLQLGTSDMEKEVVAEGVLKSSFAKVRFTLNIIEFGVPREEINSKVDQEIRNMEEYFSI
ncbi:MAG: hypothetical protein H5T85_03425 [Actinobacteria bacterium]|nr:hypothetical protein [Actinomycetota bacterium]